jgi:hypothetical protein
MASGNVMYGVGFHSKETMYPWQIDKSAGVFHINEVEETGGVGN